MKERESFHLILVPIVRGGWRISVDVRLRAALKSLLRNYGLKVQSCRPVTEPENQNYTAPARPTQFITKIISTCYAGPSEAQNFAIYVTGRSLTR